MTTLTPYLTPICCILTIAIAWFIYSLCRVSSVANDAIENAAIRKAAEDEVDAKIGRAVRGETKWKARFDSVWQDDEPTH